MPAQPNASVENNFTRGLVTEFTGLNFPENAATDTQNCIYTIVGDVTRRKGFDYETGSFLFNNVNRTNVAISTYVWNNVGGDGLTQLVVEQVGGTIYFYRNSTSTSTSPLSSQLLGSTVLMSKFTAPGATFDPTIECQYTDGNGYLFIFNPNCDPVYCTYNAGTIVGKNVQLWIRDFDGLPDSLANSARPATLSAEHTYNLQNQGWTNSAPWATGSTTDLLVGTGIKTFIVGTGLSISNGDVCTIVGPVNAGTGGILTNTMSGSVQSYVGATLTVNVFSSTYTGLEGPLDVNGQGQLVTSSWTIQKVNNGYLNTWFSAEGNYPSNSDVWWYFKDTTDVFNPATTQPNVSLSTGIAPRGHFIFNAFNIDRTSASGTSGLTPQSTPQRPSTGIWFQGRVWYTGVKSSFQASGDAPYYSWSENIYFSQVNVNTTTNFGNCYQINDPTSENLFSILPTDGGVIHIQGSGPIYKLFSVMNALIVFAANGVWYITGSQGIGFAANDYTIVKLSAVKSISSTSVVDVNGIPFFWNEEGIYQVAPAQGGTSLANNPLHVNPLEVSPLTVGTILGYYNNIPLQSKKYARGAYNPVTYTLQWVFKSTVETSVTDRYTYDTILNFNNYTKAWFPYTFGISLVGSGVPSINCITYVSSPGGTSAPNSIFKYTVSSFTSGSYNFTFGEENNTTYNDWVTSSNTTNYISYFVTGYKLHGQGQKRVQIPYIDVFSRNTVPTSYKIQSLWDYASTGNSGRWSIAQLVNNWNPNYGMIFRRHRLRGWGLVLQLKVTSANGLPFDIMGWSIYENINAGV